MKRTLDTARDEIRLSKPLVDRLCGRLRFKEPAVSGASDLLPVDVAATNDALVLDGRSLRSFVTRVPGDTQIPKASAIAADFPLLAAEQIVVVLLCGGVSFRSRGTIHPLLVVDDPRTGRRASLLDRQLDRLAASPLGRARCIVIGNPLNERPLRELLARRPPSPTSPRLCLAGLVPRLLPHQPGHGPLVPWLDRTGRIAYNPFGHFDALRWVMLGGLVHSDPRPEVIVVMSYSNWGQVFTEDTRAIASFARESIAKDASALFVAEVVARHPTAEKGSFLVTDEARPDKLCLVKPGYGCGAPRIACKDEILLSTNTLYFSVSRLIARLAERMGDGPGTATAVGVRGEPQASSPDLDRRAAAFEAAFPVPPFLIPTPTEQEPEFLRAERDLDQISLLPGHSLVDAVQVPGDRAIFVKLREDLEDREKARALFSWDHRH